MILKNNFKAAVLFKQKQKLKVIDLDFPKKLKKGQVLVKVISASICGAQIGEIRGIKGPDKWLPHCMGHEGYGEVILKNKFVTNVNIGDYVIMHWRKGPGINAKPPSYNSKYGKVNAGQVTTFQEFSVVSENRVTRVNKIEKKYQSIAPLLGCAIPTSWGILNNEISINTNHRYLVLGAGGVGTNLALIAKIYKIKNLIVADKYKKKEFFLRKLGINFINIKDLKKNFFSFENVIDTTGNTKLISAGFDLLTKNGKLMLVGQPRKNELLKINDPLRLFNHPCDHLKILTSDGGLFEPQTQMKKIYNLLFENIKNFQKTISHNITLNNINKGIDYVKKGKAIRVSIKF